MVTLTFDKQQLAILDAAVKELPYRLAAPLIAHINAEIQKNFDAAADKQDAAMRSAGGQ